MNVGSPKADIVYYVEKYFERCPLGDIVPYIHVERGYTILSLSPVIAIKVKLILNHVLIR